MKNILRAITRQRDRGRRVADLTRENGRLAEREIEAQLARRDAERELAELRRSFDEAMELVGRLRKANIDAAGEIIRLKSAYEGCKLQLEARDIMCDEMESEVERLRASLEGHGAGVPA